MVLRGRRFAVVRKFGFSLCKKLNKIHPVFLWAGDWTAGDSGSASPEHVHQKTVTAMDARDAKENREKAASTAARAARRPGLTGIVLGTLACF